MPTVSLSCESKCAALLKGPFVKLEVNAIRVSGMFCFRELVKIRR